MYYIGIDLGTSAVKLLLMDETGSIANIVSREYPIAFPHPGWSEQDPADWWAAVCDSIRGAISKAGADPSEIGGIGLSGQMHGLVMLDGEGKVLRRSIIWCDQRTGKECDEIHEKVGKDRQSGAHRLDLHQDSLGAQQRAGDL